ncbi:MAG: hypothetical protein Q9193_000324 [Seirophora villosa]
MYTLSAFSPLSSYAKNPLFQNSVEDQTAARTNGTSTVDRCCNRGSMVEASVFQPESTLFHHTSFEYPVKTESEALEHIGSYAGHLPFMADSHVRPDGYGLLDHQLLQSMSMPMPMSTPKYSRFPGNFEIPPYVSPFLVRT